MGQTDRRKSRTRKMLLDAFLELIFEKGFNAVTIREITERANVGRTTFYLHFQDKEELLLSGFDALHETLTNRINGLLTNSTEAGISISAAIFQHAKDNYPLYRVLDLGNGAVLINKRIRDYMASVIQQQIEAQRPVLSVPAEVLAYHATGSFFSLITWWLDNRMPNSPEEMATWYHCLLIHGFSDFLEIENDNFPHLSQSD